MKSACLSSPHSQSRRRTPRCSERPSTGITSLSNVIQCFIPNGPLEFSLHFHLFHFEGTQRLHGVAVFAKASSRATVCSVLQFVFRMMRGEGPEVKGPARLHCGVSAMFPLWFCVHRPGSAGGSSPLPWPAVGRREDCGEGLAEASESLQHDPGARRGSAPASFSLFYF